MERAKTFTVGHRLISIVISLILITACQSNTSNKTPTVPPTTTPQTTAIPQPETRPQASATPEAAVDPTTPTAEIEPDLSGNTWTKLYGGPYESLGSDLVHAQDGGFFMVGGIGNTFNEDRSGGVLLIKTDKDGQLEWKKEFGGNEFDIGWLIQETNDGNLLIAGQTTSFGAGGMDIYLVKVNQQGDELWSKTIGSPLDEAVSSVFETPDGGLLLVGNQVDPTDFITDPGAAGYAGFAGRSSIYVVKTDDDGNEIWSRAFDSQENVIASSGVPVLDGGWMILATILYFPSFDNDLYLLKIDENGHELWSRTWEEDAYAGYNMIGTLDNGFLITGVFETEGNPAGDLYLLKLDADGNELWMQHFGEPEIYEAGHGIVETKNGQSLLLASASRNLYASRSHILLIKVDSEGSMLWQHTIDLFDSSKANAFLQHSDGGYVITGSASRFGDTQNAFLLKTEKNGNTTEEVETVQLP